MVRNSFDSQGVITTMTIEFFKRIDEYCFTFINIRFGGVGIDFFVDYEGWFVYVYYGDKFWRFSSGGVIRGQRS